jgi:hypothetical protein
VHTIAPATQRGASASGRRGSRVGKRSPSRHIPACRRC